MTARAAREVIDSVGSIEVNGLRFNVKVIDVKNVYGCERYLIVPRNGTGESWVNADRVRSEAN